MPRIQTIPSSWQRPIPTSGNGPFTGTVQLKGRPQTGNNIFSSDKITLNAGSITETWTGFLSLKVNVEGAMESANTNARHRIMANLAMEMEIYAKANAPWEDRTGNARQSLKGHYLEDAGEWQSAAAISSSAFEERNGKEHGYSVFLETANGGKNAIIMPTILHFTKIMEEMVSGKLFTTEKNAAMNSKSSDLGGATAAREHGPFPTKGQRHRTQGTPE